MMNVRGVIEMLNKHEYEYKNTKSIFGVKIIANKKYFYKKTKNINKEIFGFNEVNQIYDVPKIVYCDNDEIVYEYQQDLETRTIHEYLYNKKPIYINYHKIFRQYKKSINSLIIQEESLYRNSDFFLKRVSQLEKYLKLPQIDKTYIFENEEYSLKNIILDIKNFIEKDKKIKGILTLGDPTDTNISVSGIFTDLECAGYNSIIGEIAILFISLTTHGSYFYPKYNGNAYILRTNLLFNYPKYQQLLVYFDNPDNKCILLPKFTILKKNKKVLLKFLKFYNRHFKDDMEISKYLKYYICMRILTPLDITKMDDYDQKTIASLIIYFYKYCTDIKSLIRIVKKLKVKKN